MGAPPPPAMPPPPAPGHGYAQPPTDGMAITALVLGIVAFPGICCYGLPAIICGVIAVILGRMAMGKIRAAGGAIGGYGLAQAGWICGLIAGALGAIYLVFNILVLVGLIFSHSSGGGTFPYPFASPTG